MVNFKCCLNIFVIFLGKKMDLYIVGFFFFFWRKKNYILPRGQLWPRAETSATCNAYVADMSRRVWCDTWHNGNVDYLDT
jgi:hypothetical protein